MVTARPPDLDPASVPLAGRARIQELREAVGARARDRPGVYRMIGAGKEVLYVGKSVRIRTRLLSYFRAPAGAKAGELIRSTRRVTWEYLPDEFGALLHEMRLIRAHRPRFNVQHKSRRGPRFIKITREAAPRILLVSRPSQDGAEYFGPVPPRRSTARAVADLVHLMGIRDCPARTPIRFGDQLSFLDLPSTALCSRGQFGSCPAPCAGSCSEARYLHAVAEARRFLQGKGEGPLPDLTERIRRAAGARKFELAAKLRDRLTRIEDLRDALCSLHSALGRLDFLYLPVSQAGSGRIYFVRRGRVTLELERPGSGGAREAAERDLLQALRASPPHLPLEDLDGAAERLLVAGWFRRHPEELSRTIAPEEWLRRQGGIGTAYLLPNSATSSNSRGRTG
jgi:excinuclease ABC subunit C